MPDGFIYLIPTYLSDTNDKSFLAPVVSEVIINTTHYLVENVRTARRFISSLNLDVDIPSLHFEIVDKNTDASTVSRFCQPIIQGLNIGIISEAGLPGLADPGALIVSWAHQNNVKVVPVPGATSIQTAVTTSGFSGQHYTFHGYLPIQKSDRIKTIREMESNLRRTGYTQVFMETPYRNMALLEDLIASLHADTLLHIASDLFGKQEITKTLSVKAWKKEKVNLHKIPTVFCIGQF